MNTHEWELAGGCRFILWVGFFQILICYSSLHIAVNNSLNLYLISTYFHLLTLHPHLTSMAYFLSEQPWVSSLVWRTSPFWKLVCVLNYSISFPKYDFCSLSYFSGCYCESGITVSCDFLIWLEKKLHLFNCFIIIFKFEMPLLCMGISGVGANETYNRGVRQLQLPSLTRKCS